MFRGSCSEPVDYLSIGPVFATTTKQTTKAPIRAEGVRRLRDQAGSSVVLVAVGGMTLATAPAILAAGASTMGVAAAIFRAADPAAEFRRWVKALGLGAKSGGVSENDAVFVSEAAQTLYEIKTTVG